MTYLHLIARFCRTGDVSGASLILEQLKKSDMSVNEYVFHSLILGNAASDDDDAARSTLGIMKESGLHVGAEAYLHLMLGQIIAGKGLEEITATIKEAKEAEVRVKRKHLYIFS